VDIYINVYENGYIEQRHHNLKRILCASSEMKSSAFSAQEGSNFKILIVDFVLGTSNLRSTLYHSVWFCNIV
jgi:hypothetical protein